MRLSVTVLIKATLRMPSFYRLNLLSFHIRDMRKFKGIFTSVIDLKVKLMEELDQVPPTTRFSVGYFEGRQSTKKWLVSQDDLTAMYSSLKKSGKTDVYLWCNGRSEETDESSRKRKRDDSFGLQSKRATKEKEVDDLVAEIKEIHSKEHNYSDPQYRLWARMIVNGLHSSVSILRLVMVARLP